MTNPSPPNRPPMIFFWKCTFNSTPSVAARNALFWQIIGLEGVISTGMIFPGNDEANAIIPRSFFAVYRFCIIFSPLSIRPNIFPNPPPLVCISILGVIQLMDPDSQTTVSPASTSQITTGMVSPLISYFIITSYPCKCLSAASWCLLVRFLWCMGYVSHKMNDSMCAYS